MDHTILFPNKMRKWKPDETSDLIRGCHKHGVGAWKKIMDDPELHFCNRSSVDLKDKFRTLYPNEYKRLYPGKGIIGCTDENFRRVGQKVRHVYTIEEDRALERGVEKYGPCWAKIAKDPVLGLSHRRGIHLRDRYRTRFPKKYSSFGYSTTGPRRLRADAWSNEENDSSAKRQQTEIEESSSYISPEEEFQRFQNELSNNEVWIPGDNDPAMKGHYIQ
ncbi:uncharacterized protein VTP21DRAFT_662 [Calcarisporiella thermophila]|uniref:uncharacterized protein n=1 Tax=Calcarisporiella thermophila TaxID=911321 RepID=UPI003743AA05